MRYSIYTKLLTKIDYQAPPAYSLVLLWIFIILSFLITIDVDMTHYNQRVFTHCIQEIREMSYSIFITIDIFRMRFYAD